FGLVRGACAAALLDDFGQLNHVPERIGEESYLAANLFDLKRFAEDLYVAAARHQHMALCRSTARLSCAAK
ncbi:hypothetical protein, partial [Rhizobium johnstonii]|uniref:hypothetical protein n=1 Tax=Rhizobium johnstonii TaxID=3019933 RepID=UPI003F9605EA